MRTVATASSPSWFQQDLRRQLPIAVRGEGIRIWDREGHEYLAWAAVQLAARK